MRRTIDVKFYKCNLSQVKSSHLRCMIFLLTFVYIQCDPEQHYTCWDGKCISIEERCDKVVNCDDESDEKFCQQIKIDNGRYRKAYAPENPSGDRKLDIHVWFDVNDVIEINEPEVSNIMTR